MLKPITVKIVKLKEMKFYVDDFIKERAENSTHGINSEKFYITADNSAVGHMTLDLWAIGNFICLYEIYIIPKHRSFGYGTLGVQLAEEFAKTHNYDSIKVKPYPIEDTSIEQLQIWYQKMGYIDSNDEEGTWIKLIHR